MSDAAAHETPDRGHIPTERRHPASAAIDTMGVEQALRLINAQDMHVPTIVRDAIPAIARLVEAIVERMRHGGRLIYAGAGTSGRLGVLDASECPPTFHSDPEQVVGVIAGGDAALRQAVEAREDAEDAAREELAKLNLTPQDTVLGIAAGGTTPWVWGALAAAREHKCIAALLTCVPVAAVLAPPRAPVVAPDQKVNAPARRTLPANPDHIIELPVGPEVITGSTRMKAGTATKLALNMISTTVMIQLGKTWGNLMVDLRVNSAKLRDRALRMLQHQAELDRAEAARLLDAAGGSVKLALVMARLNLDADTARQRLDAAQGHLRPLLGPPKQK